MHISSARKSSGGVSDSELAAELAKNLPEDSECSRTACGSFPGFVAEYTDWHSDAYWRKWMLGCGSVMLFITYTCKRGEEDLEADEAASLLHTLKIR